MAKRIYFTLDLQGTAKAIDETAELTIALQKAAKAVRDAKKAGDAGMLGKALQEQKELKTQLNATNKAINEQIKEFQKTKQNIPKDSIAGLRIEYNKLTKEIDLMDKATRKSVEGMNKLAQARKLNAEIARTEQATGRNQRNVGNYASALQGVGGALTGGLIGGGALAVGAMAAQAAQAAFKEARDIVNNYGQSLADLRAVSGATESEMMRLDASAKSLGASTSFTATQVNALNLELSKLGFSVDEILNMSEAVIDLSVALGGEANETAALLGATLRSFGADASEAAKYAEVMGAAANKSAIDFQDLRIALPYVNTAAKAAGLTFAEAAAHLGVLRDNGVRAESAGTGLRNIFITAASAGKPFNELLQEITKSENQLATAAELFGKEGAIQAVIIANNTTAINNMAKAADDANGVLGVMADERLSTLIGQVTLTESAYSGLILSIDSGNGVISRAAIGWEGLKQGIFSTLTNLNEGNYSFKDFFSLLSGNPLSIIEAQTNAYTESLRKVNLEAQRASELLGGKNSVFGGLFESESVNPNAVNLGQMTGGNNWVSEKDLKDQIKSLQELRETVQIGGAAYKRYGKEIEDIEKILKRFTGKGGGKGTESAGESGSVSFLQKKLSELTMELSKIDPASKGFVQAAKNVDQFAEKLEKAKEAQDALLGKLAEQRRRAGDPTNNTPTEGIGGLNLIPDAISQLPLSQTQKDIDARNKLFIDGRKKASDALRKQGQEEAAKDTALAEDIAAEKNRIVNETFQAAIQAANAIFDLQMDQERRLEERRLKALDKEFDKRREAAGGDKELLLRLEEQYEKKKEAIQRASFEKQKKIQIKQAIINGALAAIQAVANTVLPFPASLAAAIPIALLTGVNIATIKAQQYAEGGFTPTASGKLGKKDSTGRRVAGVVHEAEYVAPTTQIQRYPELFRFLESDRQNASRKFAVGGFTSAIPQVTSPTDTGGSNDMESIMMRMVEGIVQGVKAGTYEGALKAGRETMVEEERRQSARQTATF